MTVQVYKFSINCFEQVMKYCTKLRIVTQKLHGNTKPKKALLRANSEAFDGITPFRAGTQILQRLLDEASGELLLEKVFFNNFFLFI